MSRARTGSESIPQSPYRSPQWARVRRQVLERDGYRCRVQGPHCQGRATEVDHIIPWRDGGSWFDPANLRASCAWCNTWRAQRQKARDGWKRNGTRITLVTGPPGSGQLLSEYVGSHAGGDLVIDYPRLLEAVGGAPEEARKVREALLGRLRRGDVNVERAWITSTNPAAETLFPHHEVVVLDPGREAALAGIPERPDLVDEWYRRRTEAEEW